MSMMRWSPFFRGMGPRSRLLRPLMCDLSRIDSQMQNMNREMDRIFDEFHRSSPFFNPSFFEDHYIRDHNLIDATIKEKDGKKQMHFQFDVHAFKPEEIQIKTRDDGKTLEVHAKHEDTTETGTVKREYHRVLSIPNNVDAKEFESVLSPEGVLSVSAPLKEEVETPQVEKRTENVPLAINHE